uniref:Structural protein n=1 Tax=Hepeviridae sp. TaxID=2715178 RepID=A0A6M3YPI0_9VIRU|nr:MAG: structural protein [Hepeviridae sp.]
MPRFNRNNLAPRARIGQRRRGIPGFQRRGILRQSRQPGRFTVNDVWDVAAPTINQGGLNLPIGPDVDSYGGSKFVIDASTYNTYHISSLYFEFIPSQNRFNAKNQIAVWVSSDPAATPPDNDEQIRQQCMAAKGFIFHSEFTFRNWLRVPASIFKNFSTGQGDSAAGTNFQPQGRVFAIPLAGDDTTNWTYGIANIRFRGRLSGPGSYVGGTTRTITDNPYVPERIHNITNWDDNAKRTYIPNIRNTISSDVPTQYVTYYTNATTPTYTFAVSLGDTRGNEEDDSFPSLAGTNYAKITTKEPDSDGQKFYSWNNTAVQWETYDPSSAVYVRVRPDQPLQITSQKQLQPGHFPLYTTESLNSNPTHNQDSEGRDTVNTNNIVLQNQIDDLRTLIEGFKAQQWQVAEESNQQIAGAAFQIVGGGQIDAGNITAAADANADNITNAIKSLDITNHKDNQEIISSLGGVVKSGDAITVDGEITIEGVPPVEGAAQFFPAVIAKI